jgi:hypothetical protein
MTNKKNKKNKARRLRRMEAREAILAGATNELNSVSHQQKEASEGYIFPLVYFVATLQIHRNFQRVFSSEF